MKTFLFRAECEVDVINLRTQLGTKITEITMTMGLLPDVDVKIKTELSLRELQDEMREVVDGYVMVETVAYEAEYTGIRTYSSGRAVDHGRLKW